MLALLASLLVILYLVVPGFLFRIVFGLFVPLRAFDRASTREQLAYAVLVCVAPLSLALLIVWQWWSADTWSAQMVDYRRVLIACFSDRFLPNGTDGADLWNSAAQSFERLTRVLSVYLPLVAAEAIVLGIVAMQWGRIRRWLNVRVERGLSALLFANISEWHVLLTPFLFPGQKMHVDAMTTDDRLYQGDVLTYTLDQGGKLTGMYLSNAQRYNRTALIEDRKAGRAKLRSDYWVPIPGERLFLFADRLSSLNIRPEAPPEMARKELTEFAGGLEGLGGRVDVETAAAATKSNAAETSAVESPAPTTLNIGDRVRLSSGGPVMTVTNTQVGSMQKVYCEWFDEGSKAAAKAYPPEALVRVGD